MNLNLNSQDFNVHGFLSINLYQLLLIDTYLKGDKMWFGVNAADVDPTQICCITEAQVVPALATRVR